jgi:predicted nucleotidyltransferase
MRNSTLEVLLPAVRRDVLAATLMHPDRWWYLSDLAVHVKRTPSSLQREVAQLAKAGILDTRQESNRTYYRPNADCPILPELTGLIAKTVGVADVVRRAISPLAKKIEWAFIFGSLARGQEGAESDIDLLVIGDITLAAMAKQIKAAEKRLSRPINPSVYPRREIEAKLRTGQHFICTVVAGKKLFLLGEPREFASTFNSATSAASSNQPQRARRTALRRRTRS